MNRRSTKPCCLRTFLILAILTLTIAACGSSSDLATQVSGQWRNEKGNDAVNIKLTKDTSSLTINGQTFKGTVETIDNGSNTVHVKVATKDGSTEVWSLQQVWNDNGSAFKLMLRRNGTTETLIPVEHS